MVLPFFRVSRRLLRLKVSMNFWGMMSVRVLNDVACSSRYDHRVTTV